MKKPLISIIAAVGSNLAIGKNNKLIWNIPNDLKHFKKITSGHVVIMGQKTFESIGKPLPDRHNIVITNNKNFRADGITLAHSINDSIEKASETDNEEIFIIGGGSIYQQFIERADKLYLTLVDDSPEGADVFFPDYSEFKNEIAREEHEENGIKYSFVELIR